MLRSIVVPGLAPGPVPWIHCRLEIPRDVGALETAVARVLHRDRRAADGRRRIEKGNRLPIARAPRAPRNPGGHQFAPLVVEVRQRLERAAHAPGQHIGVRVEQAITNIETGSE